MNFMYIVNLIIIFTGVLSADDDLLISQEDLALQFETWQVIH